jgi:SPP1 family predicted phage head-tail adaptor
MRRAAIGALRQPLTLEAPIRTEGEGGTATLAWSVVAQVWAAIAPLTGREMVSADAVAGRVTHEVRLRFRGGVRPEMRFTIGSRMLEIRAVLDEGERHRWLVCLCEERAP